MVMLPPTTAIAAIALTFIVTVWEPVPVAAKAPKAARHRIRSTVTIRFIFPPTFRRFSGKLARSCSPRT